MTLLLNNERHRFNAKRLGRLVLTPGIEPGISTLKGWRVSQFHYGTIKSEDETVVMSPRRPFGIKKFNSPQIKFHTKFITSSTHYSSYATRYPPG